MKNVIIYLLFLFIVPLKGQNNQNVIKFTYKLKVDWLSTTDKKAFISKVESLREKLGNVDNLIGSFNRDSATFEYYVNKDSILQLIFNNNDIYPTAISLQNANILYGIDPKTGIKLLISDTVATQKRLDKLLGKEKFKPDVSFRKEIKKTTKRENIIGFECYKYNPLNPNHPFQGNTNYWITNNYRQLSDNNSIYLFNELFYDKMLIVKSQTFFREQNAYQTQQLSAIDTLNNTSILQNYESLMYPKNSITWAYTDIKENRGLDTMKLEKQSSIYDFSFRVIKDSSIQQIGKLTENTSYLLIDIWGSWCKPCLKMFPDLLNFQKKYSNKLKVISLNYNDSTPEKVQKIIEQYQLKWTQGYASHSLIDYLNPTKEFPKMILLDKNLKIILIGEPDLDLSKVENILLSNERN